MHCGSCSRRQPKATPLKSEEKREYATDSQYRRKSESNLNTVSEEDEGLEGEKSFSEPVRRRVDDYWFAQFSRIHTQKP